jgi:hypothetical protein
MQSASDLPPPPGLLGADSLPDELPGERTRLGAEPPPVANWLGQGSDMGESGGTVHPGCTVVGAVGAVAPGAPAGGVTPAEGVSDNDGDGAAGVAGAGAVDKVAAGAESLALGAIDPGAPAAEARACANGVLGSSSKRAIAARRVGLGVSIAATIVSGSTPILLTNAQHFAAFHKLASGAYLLRCLRHGSG